MKITNFIFTLLLVCFFSFLFFGIVHAEGEKCFCLTIPPVQVEEEISAISEESQCQPGIAGQNYASCEWKVPVTTPTLNPTETEGAKIALPSGVSDLNQLKDLKITDLIGRVIKTAMGIIGGIFLLLMIYGGVIWMTGSTTVGGGATKKDITKAKGIIVWATLGLLVILSSYAIVNFLFEIFNNN